MSTDDTLYAVLTRDVAMSVQGVPAKPPKRITAGALVEVNHDADADGYTRVWLPGTFYSQRVKLDGTVRIP